MLLKNLNFYKKSMLIAVISSCLPVLSSNYKPLKIEAAPIVDGKLEETCWTLAEEISDFKFCSSTKKQMEAIQQTDIKICYDDNYIYIGAVCHEKSPDKIKQEYKSDNNSALYSDDCVEIFIAPDYLNRRQYIQYIVNSLGSKYERLSSDGGWKSSWQAAATVNKDNWTVEIKIPVTDFGAEHTKEIDLVGISICRERWVKGHEEWSKWPLGGTFHQADGHLLFKSYNDYLDSKNKLWNDCKNRFMGVLNKYPNFEGKFKIKFLDIIKTIELQNQKFLTQKSISSEEFNSYIKSLACVNKQLALLEKDLEFSAFLATGNNGNDFVLRTTTSMEKIFPNTFKQEWLKPGTGDEISLDACRNEGESFQIAIIPFKDLKNFTWKISGDISPEYIKIQPVGYVNIKENSSRDFLTAYPQADIITGDWPDPLFSTWTDIKNIEAAKIQPLWITVNIPCDMKAGNYNGIISFQAEGSRKGIVNFKLKVRNFELPRKMSLKTSFWWIDAQLARYYPEIKGKDFLEMKKRFLNFLLDYKITPSYFQIFEKIKVTYNKETEKYTFDFSEWDKELRLITERNGQVANLIFALNHSTRDGLYPGSGINFQGGKQTSAEHKKFLTQYLAAAKNFYNTNGWSQMVYLNYSEEPGKATWETAKWTATVLKQAAPEWATVVPVNFQPSAEALDKYIDIMALGLFSSFNEKNLHFYLDRQKKGKDDWAYICAKTSCIDFMPIDHRIWTWYCQKYNLTGFIYWGWLNWTSYNSPGKHPELFVAESKKRWPNMDKEWNPATFDLCVPGDGYFVYPSPDGNPWSSIRLENIRDAIEDYEYFHILKERLNKYKQKKDADIHIINAAEKLLYIDNDIIKSTNSYTRDWNKLLERREKIADMIENLAQ